MKYDSIARYLVAAAHDLLATCLTSQGKTDEAMRHFNEAVRIDPSSPVFHTNLAIALAQTGSLDQAIVEFREVVRLEGDACPHRINLANVLLAKGEAREAAQICREVLERDPQSEPAAELLEAALAAEQREPAGSDRHESHGP